MKLKEKPLEDHTTSRENLTTCGRIRPYLLRGPEESPLYAAMAGLPTPVPAETTERQAPAPSTVWPLALSGFQILVAKAKASQRQARGE